jgi:hypothetical protein
LTASSAAAEQRPGVAAPANSVMPQAGTPLTTLSELPLEPWAWPHAPPQPPSARAAEPPAPRADAEAPAPPLPPAQERQQRHGPWRSADGQPVAWPPAVQQELALGRELLLLAPQQQQATLRGWWLRCVAGDPNGWSLRPAVVRGAGAAQAEPGGWALWRLASRALDEGQPEPASTPSPFLPPWQLRRLGATHLALRLHATTAAAPLRDAHTAWLDLMEPQHAQRLWQQGPGLLMACCTIPLEAPAR